MPQTRVKKVIAGPGGGKTTTLIDEVLKCLPLIKSNKYLVVITYTNAATERIRSELEKNIKIPSNLFIGTIHSFLDRFILIPHASKLGIIPTDITFIDDLIVNDSRYKQLATKNARDRGIITYEQIEWISEKIICGGNIKVKSDEIKLDAKTSSNHARSISKRLQCVFVDEYQDATVKQHNIFTALINTNLIDYFYCVGDPEQYIYGFTYKGSNKRPSYKDIPINKIDSLKDVESNQIFDNFRSKPEIINFINQFAALKQVTGSFVQSEDKPRVIFIKSIIEKEIIDSFLSSCSQLELSEKTKFFLTHAKNTLTGSTLTNINQLLDPSLNSERLLSETVKYLCSLTGLSQNEIFHKKDWNKIDLRKMAMQVLQRIRSGSLQNESDVKNMLSQDFGLISTADRQFSKKTIDTFEKIFSSANNIVSSPLNILSTIHKSKGLEAFSVLVVAKNKKQLINWLEIDTKKRSEDINDICRVGFVAFSRARDLLCIACLEDISDLHPLIQSMGLNII